MSVTVVDLGVAFEMPSLEAYEQSAFWWLRRGRYLLEHPDAACICGRRDVQLHHLSYRRLGEERDEELLPLCPDHHYEVERHVRYSSLSRRAATMEYVEMWEGRRERSVVDGLHKLDPLAGLQHPALALTPGQPSEGGSSD